MKRLLIVNADDFGLSIGQNYGIAEACRHGVVTSTTALVNGAAIDHAVALSHELPALGVGMHFVLTLGQPLTPMPGLTRDGQLGKWVWQMAEQGTLPLTEIAQELEAQFSRFVALFGRPPTHIDSHHHVHMLPALFPQVADFARRQGVALRIDRRALAQARLSADNLRSTAAFSSDFYGEEVSRTRFLDQLDASTKAGAASLEIMCHPALIDNTLLTSSYCYPRLKELEVLTAPQLTAEIAERGYRPATFLDL